MMRGRAYGNQKNQLVIAVVVLVIFCGFLYIYSRKDGSSALAYGTNSIRKFGSSYWGGDDGAGEYEMDGVMLKSIQVSLCIAELIITVS
jgi:hypothetical protein